MADGHLLFVWSPRGYELREREGEAPPVGGTVEEDGKTLHVVKLTTSPLPGDARQCAYLAAP
jgi:hypothetical protein